MEILILIWKFLKVVVMSEQKEINLLNLTSISKIKATFSGLVKDTEDLASNIKEGNLSYRMDTTRYNGLYARIGRGINASLETISEPLKEADTILGRMALNDYTLTMSAGYKGDFATFANSINDVEKAFIYSRYCRGSFVGRY